MVINFILTFVVQNVPEDSVECKFFIIIYFDSLLKNEDKYYLQLCLDKCADKVLDKQMTGYLHDIPLKKIKISFSQIDLINGVLQ